MVPEMVVSAEKSLKIRNFQNYLQSCIYQEWLTLLSVISIIYKVTININVDDLVNENRQKLYD